MLVGVLFGLAPAWQANDLATATRLNADGRTTTRRGGGLRSALVAAEVAMAVALLFGAGLLLRTLLNVDGVDRGYRATHVLTMMVDPLGSQYPTPESLLQFFGAIERELQGTPGVKHTAWTSTLPLGESVLGDAAVEIVGSVASGREPASARGLRRGEPVLFPHAGSARSRRPRIR